MKTYRMLALVLGLSSATPAYHLHASEVSPPERKQLLPCLQLVNHWAQGCPVETFSAPAYDPADRAYYFQPPFTPLFHFQPAQDGSDLAEAIHSIERDGVAFTCMSQAGGSRKCGAPRKMPPVKAKNDDFPLPSESEVNFIYFYPPYSDQVMRNDQGHETKKLLGNDPYCSWISGKDSTKCLSTASSVDDYWVRWVELPFVNESLIDRTYKLFKELMRPTSPCNAAGISEVSGRFLNFFFSCRAITLVASKDGLGVISDCSRRRVAETLGPPIEDTCLALVAFDDQHIWIPAIVKATSGHVTGCLRDLIGNCGMAMGFDFDFSEIDKGKAYVQNNKDLANSVVERFRDGLSRPPWNISGIAYDKNLSEYTGISTKRRSQIVDGYEDLAIFISISGAKKRKDLFGMDHSSDFILSPSAGETRGLRVVMQIEIYISMYNAPDNSYWIKPTAEQEAKYRAALAKVFAESATAACAGRQLKLRMNDSTQAQCY